MDLGVGGTSNSPHSFFFFRKFGAIFICPLIWPDLVINDSHICCVASSISDIYFLCIFPLYISLAYSFKICRYPRFAYINQGSASSTLGSIWGQLPNQGRWRPQWPLAEVALQTFLIVVSKSSEDLHFPAQTHPGTRSIYFSKFILMTRMYNWVWASYYWSRTTENNLETPEIWNYGLGCIPHCVKDFSTFWLSNSVGTTVTYSEAKGKCYNGPGRPSSSP